MSLKLVFPAAEHEALWQSIITEIEEADEKIVPHTLAFKQHDFNVFLQKTIDYKNGKNLGDYVPATTYFLMDDKEHEILGAVNIRHFLNEDLLFRGGHIGYGIRPTQRKKGYATLMLGLALEKCREMGLKKVLVTCNQDNIGSAKTIINNGGILENEVTEENGTVVKRFLINL